MGRLGRIARSQITITCIVVFSADVVTGFFAPTFSLLAAQLGVSFAVLGLINTASGLTSLATSIPIGIASDRVGRPKIIRLGMLAFALSSLVVATAGGPLRLTAGRIIAALAMIGVFRITAAHLGDITSPGGRSLAFGAYATALGSGATVGAFLSGQIADRYGLETAYWIAAGIAVAGLLIAVRFLKAPERDQAGSPSRVVSFRREVFRLAGDRRLMQVSTGNLMTSMIYAGALTTFFPLHGENLGLSTSAIGTIFAIRGVVSTAGRLPNGILARVAGDRMVMYGALAAEFVVMVGLSVATDSLAMTVLLALEGLAFGGYMVASQTFIAEQIPAEVRGAAVGLNGMMSAIGSTLAPLVLGLVAGRFGVQAVFPVTAGALVAGALVMVALGRTVETLEGTYADGRADG